MSYLSNLLVMLAPYGSERPSTVQFVNLLQALGAQIIRVQAKAEVSLTRSVLAGAAYSVLQQVPALQWVFWLDQDISGDPQNILAMMHLVSVLDDPSVSVSGMYVNRYSTPPRLALYAIHGAKSVVIPADVHQLKNIGDVECVPVLAGMGCLLQSRSVFMQHCDESPHFAFPTRDTIVPEVCASRRIHSSELAKYIQVNPDEDVYYWQSEDYDYCAREWQQGRPVLAVPLSFGHECDRVLMPDEQTVFPGLRGPSHGAETR